MSNKEVFSSRLTRKEARLIKFFRLLSVEQRTEFTSEIKKMCSEDILPIFNEESRGADKFND